jgi:hypothetical protein
MAFIQLWDSPAAGDVINSSSTEPFVRGDSVDILLTFKDSNEDAVSPDLIEIIGGSLPAGLFFNSNTRRIQGTIGTIAKGITDYPVVIRATLGDNFHDRTFIFKVNPADLEHFWNDAEMNLVEIYEPVSGDTDAKDDSRIYNFKPLEANRINRGGAVNITLPIVNPDGDPLSYKAVGFKGPARAGSDGQTKVSYAGLPEGLKIDNFGRIFGSPTVTNNQPGHYYFRIYIWEPAQAGAHSGLKPKTRRQLEGGVSRPSPDQALTIPMSSRVFRIELVDEIRLDPALSDAVKWETPAGSLGSTYETFASHFSVRAIPQYEVETTVNEIQTVRYTLSETSAQLPEGLILNPENGLIVGKCPYVVGDRTYTFTVKAQIVFLNLNTGEIRASTVSSERTFSFVVKAIYVSDSVMSFNIAVPPLARLTIAKWVRGNQVEFNATDIEEGMSYQADGIQKLFAVPPRIAGKANERITAYFNDTIANIVFVRKTISGQEYIEFSSPPPKNLNVVVYRYGNQPHNLEATLLTVLGNDNIFRPSDTYYGKVRPLNIMLANGITTPAPDPVRQAEIIDETGVTPEQALDMVRDEKIMISLRDYHHKMVLRFGNLKVAKGYDPSGRYVYDMLYIEVVDPLANAGGFNSFGQDELLPKPVYQNKLNLPNRAGNTEGPNIGESTGVPAWNLPQGTDRYHPASINNVRKDLINKANRVAWAPYPTSSEMAKYNQTASQRGLGIMGREGLPFWMDCNQVPGNPATRLGYVPAIELAYLKPSTGAQILKTLLQAGFEDDLIGSEIFVDRYLMISDGVTYTSFIDDEAWDPSDTNHTAPIYDEVFDSICSFDGPDNLETPTAEYTTFDLALEPISKYYKFPPSDRTTI